MTFYWIDLGLIVAFSAVVLGCLYGMRRNGKWSHSIVVHAIYLLSVTGLLLTVNTVIDQLLVHYKVTLVQPDFIDDLTYVAIGLAVIEEMFHLINRLTYAQVQKGSDRTSATSVARVLKMAIVLSLVLLFGEHLGLSLSGLLAFGGFGGIAIGIAGKDVLSNVFSGVMLYFDRPFNLGDWIRSPDRQIEGSVEEIGWRMTRITTFDNRPLYVPNSLFSSISVENPGQMRNRRISTSINVRYEDAAKINAIITDIRAMLRGNPSIDLKQDLLIYFNEFGEYSLNIMVYCFTKTTNWAEWLDVQQDVYLKIIEIVHNNGADFADPKQVISIEKAEAAG